MRLRSIGDTVLSTPSLFALKRFLPHAAIDILLEDWVAPVLDGFPHVDNVITVEKERTASRARVARRLRANRYDVVYNLHGGTTATLLTRATGAKHRVGYETYQYARLHNHLSPSSSLLWGRDKTHSVEQQLALLGWTGVPVSDRPRTQLAVTEPAAAAVAARLRDAGLEGVPFVVIHPAAAFATKQWAADKFGRVAEELAAQGLAVVVITTPDQTDTVEELKRNTSTPVLSLNESVFAGDHRTAGARAIVCWQRQRHRAHGGGRGNSRSRNLWIVKHGTLASVGLRCAGVGAEIVFEEMDCQPCHGYFCEKFEQPECIKRVPVERVMAAIERVLRESKATCNANC